MSGFGSVVIVCLVGWCCIGGWVLGFVVLLLFVAG